MCTQSHLISVILVLIILHVLVQGKEKPDTVDSGETLEASDIVVVHTKSCPRLHSILKQHTISESSDDGRRLSVSGDRQTSTASDDASDSDDGGFNVPLSSSMSSENGFRRLKKSVSFNDRIDHAVFQANQSVSSMHAILKNRRRRARKRDQYLQQKAESSRGTRRRCRSSGSISMEDSGDEHHGGVVNRDAFTSKFDQCDARQVELTRSVSMDDCSPAMESMNMDLVICHKTAKPGSVAGKKVESMVKTGKDGVAVTRNITKGISPQKIANAEGRPTREPVPVDQSMVENHEGNSDSAQVEENMISNYSGIPTAKMTRSGRNAINSSGAFRTSASGFYHRDYETLGDIVSTVGNELCDNIAHVCDAKSVNGASDLKSVECHFENSENGSRCDGTVSVACIQTPVQPSVIRDLALGHSDQPCRQGLAEQPVPCVSLTVAAGEKSSFSDMDS
jgi:hypothetical protein